MPRLYNKNEGDYPAEAVYIGRGSVWGNPLVIGIDGTREEVIEKHRNAILAVPSLQARIKAELKGKDLVCYCHPRACHGDILLQIANEDYHAG